MKGESEEISVRISDQFPKYIQEKGRNLIPLLIQAKSEGKSAYVSQDKLYINGEIYSGSGVQES